MQRNAHEEKILLRLPGYQIMEYRFEKAHHWLQGLAYQNPSLKSIHKKQHNYFFNSTSITALSVLVDHGFHRFSLNLIGIRAIGFTLEVSSTGQCSCKMFESSLDVSRALKMISFWVATPFWVSSQPAQRVLLVLTRIPPELKVDPSRVPLFHGGTPFICELPAAHGLGAICKTSPWLSTHATLVFPLFRSSSLPLFPSSPWLSAHAALVSLSDDHANLRFTNLPLAQNNDSHSEYMPPASQRLNYPGNILPPGLQLILHSTFVTAGAIPSIEIIQLLSNIHRRFMWLSPINSPRGERSR